ncbi:hypothetical protein O181_022782 [Austropuccinia psidii MF-1]|uniref:Uncharacterized protein n=1 Tax=Austropuccinia psidii MF-1 TaxID=1389203 RepID=A0A9Q3CG64_9BASI|nr:hypothetical protein [Austropuccinia psidii MF-1]
MENVQQDIQPGIPLERTWSKFPEDLSKIDRLQRPYGNHQMLESHQKQDKGDSSHYPSYRRTADPDREYSYSFRLTRSTPNQLSSGLTPFRNQQISGQESPFFTIPGSFQEKTRKDTRAKTRPPSARGRKSQTQDLKAVGFGERSSKEPEVVVHNSRISRPINRNITPTHIEQNVVTPLNNLNSDVLMLHMS